MADTPGSGEATEPADPQVEPDEEVVDSSAPFVPTPGMLGADVEDEVELGDSDIGKDANKALRSLARAARSFLMYDPGNAAIKIFLKQIREILQDVENEVAAWDGRGYVVADDATVAAVADRALSSP